jgi:predicted Zn-dependent peptidase
MRSKKRIGLVASILGLALSAAGAISPPQKKILPNGLTVITQKDDASAITALEIVIRGGQRSEPPGKEGLAFLLTRLAMDIPDEGKVREFMAKALHYTMTVRSDSAVIHLECLTEFFDGLLGEYLDILTDPLINNIRIDRIKEFLDHQRRIESDDAANAGRLAHLEDLFHGTGYSASIYGTKESVASLKVREARDYYERYFTAGNMIVVAVSDLDDAVIQGILAKRFAKLRAASKAASDALPSPRPSAEVAPSPRRDPRIIEKDARQAFIGAAFVLPPADKKTFVSQMLVENVLGKGPGSRLWSLRTERNLAYNVSAAAIPMKDAGLLQAFLETSPEKTEEARKSLAQSLLEFHEKGLSAEELETGKAEVGAMFIRSNELKSARVSTLGTMEALGLGAGLYAEFAGELAALTLDEVNAYIRAALKPEAASWVIVGPKK